MSNKLTQVEGTESISKICLLFKNASFAGVKTAQRKKSDNLNKI